MEFVSRTSLWGPQTESKIESVMRSLKEQGMGDQNFSTNGA